MTASSFAGSPDSASSGNRSSIARRKKRQLRHGDITATIELARKLATPFRTVADSELASQTDLLRHRMRRAEADEHQQILGHAGALMIESIRRVLAMDLFDVQLHAGIVVSNDAVAEMQTGEGKTLSVALPAYFKALSGQGVHVATPNQYLADRDCEKLSPVFKMLGMTTGRLVEKARPDETRDAYLADVTYGPGHAFGFDYLRDQLTLAGPPAVMGPPAAMGPSTHRSRIGWDVLQRAKGCSPESNLLQRGLHASIVDEIDHVLLDDAVSPLLLSGSGDEESPDAEVHQAALELSCMLNETEHFQFDQSKLVKLTTEGFDRVYEVEAMAMHRRLVRPWHEYVLLALRAKHQFRRDVHYVVRDQDVQIIDASTGRIFEDRTWSEGLHQAVQAAEGLTVTSESMPLAKITRQRFYRYYQSLGGMTGTAAGCEREFASVYGLPIVAIPLRVPTRREFLPEKVFATHEEKLSAIVSEAELYHDSGRAVLIGTLSVEESHAVAEELGKRGLSFSLLNGIQDADEASVVAQSGRQGAITVATNLAGRGTDISLEPEVRRLGGLHVIVTEKHSLARVDRQLIGRCARCGDPGSARVFVSADDALTGRHAPWLGRAICRAKGSLTQKIPGLRRRLARVQRSLQRRESAMRWSLLQSDRENEKLLTKRSSSPAGCCQL